MAAGQQAVPAPVRSVSCVATPLAPLAAQRRRTSRPAGSGVRLGSTEAGRHPLVCVGCAARSAPVGLWEEVAKKMGSERSASSFAQHWQIMHGTRGNGKARSSSDTHTDRSAAAAAAFTQAARPPSCAAAVGRDVVDIDGDTPVQEAIGGELDVSHCAIDFGEGTSLLIEDLD